MRYVPILDCENFLFLERSGPKGFRRDKRWLASASLLKCGRRHARFWGDTREMLLNLKNLTVNRRGKGKVSSDEPSITARLCFRCVVCIISFNPCEVTTSLVLPRRNWDSSEVSQLLCGGIGIETPVRLIAHLRLLTSRLDWVVLELTRK